MSLNTWFCDRRKYENASTIDISSERDNSIWCHLFKECQKIFLVNDLEISKTIQDTNNTSFLEHLKIECKENVYY